MSRSHILALDTSTELMAVAVQSHEGVVRIEAERGLQHGAELAPAITSALAAASVEPPDLDLVVVGIGPGSFTGVRIGIATAKGLAAARSVPVAGVSGLDAFGWRYRHYLGPVVPTVDGRKQRVYGATYLEGERVTDYVDLSARDLVADVLSGSAVHPAAAPPLLCGPAARLVGDATGEATADWLIDASAAGRAIPIDELLELGVSRGGGPARELQPLYLRRSEAELGIR